MLFRRTFLKLFSLLAAPPVLGRPLFQTMPRWRKPAERCGPTWLYYAAPLSAVPDKDGWIPAVYVRHRLTTEPKLGTVVKVSGIQYRITEVRREPPLVSRHAISRPIVRIEHVKRSCDWPDGTRDEWEYDAPMVDPTTLSRRALHDDNLEVRTERPSPDFALL